MTTTRRTFIAAVSTAAAPAAVWANGPALQLNGRYIQGGAVIGRTTPRATVMLDGEVVGRASASGLFIAGFDRDCASQQAIKVTATEGTAEHIAAIAPGGFDVQKIDGLPQDQVTPQGAALLAKIAAESSRKAAGFASNIDGDYFSSGFVMPVAATRQSSRFGGQRILNGVAQRPHYGADLAAPVGTPVIAPADGVASFAETGLHYEGGLILIDHGQGLISAYLHLSKVDIKRGEKVVRGQRIGAVGKEGRATGPHLCWRLKWRGRNLDPMQLLGLSAPTEA